MNRFKLGQTVATPGALAAIEASGESVSTYLNRHGSGDWGIVDADDARENEYAGAGEGDGKPIAAGPRVLACGIRRC